jgi:hypothetical protein
MSTTVTPISIVRRQDAALTVATTNMMARPHRHRTDRQLQPGEPAEDAHGQQQHRHQSQAQQADRGERVQHLLGPIRGAPGQHIARNGAVS